MELGGYTYLVVDICVILSYSKYLCSDLHRLSALLNDMYIIHQFTKGYVNKALPKMEKMMAAAAQIKSYEVGMINGIMDSVTDDFK